MEKRFAPNINLNNLHGKFLAIIAAGAFALSGCANEEGNAGQSSVDISSSTGRLIDEMQCYIDAVPDEDCDGDYVLNYFDRHPGYDDREFDIDSDGIPDYTDTFYGNNRGDADSDGLVNGFDVQPYAAPPSGVAPLPPKNISNDQLVLKIIGEQANASRIIQEVYGYEGDADMDGIDDLHDSTPTPQENDRDRDGDPDFYDPEPRNGYIDSKNDPYDPRNDEYWKKDD